jgi:outer membrane protein TolC
MGPGRAAEPPAPAPAALLTLDACRRIALEKQPSLAAYRASVAAAEARAKGLEDLLIPTVVRRDLPMRRKQSALGVQIAQAQLRQAEAETIYAVTWNYLTVLYGREQQGVADDALRSLSELESNVKEINPKHWLLRQTAVYKAIANSRKAEAVEGAHRALAALREAMGESPDCCFLPADGALGVGQPAPCLEQLQELALARRGELLQAVLSVDITALEVQAQGTTHLPTARTFADASDIHAQPVPQGLHDGYYRPGAISLEMPPNLVGPRSARVAQAQDLNARAQAIVAKTQNLLRLEVEDAYRRWSEASQQIPQLDEAAQSAKTSATDLKADAKNLDAKTSPSEALNAGILYSQVRVQLNQARYQYLAGLAALERVTVGGFCPQYGLKP